MEVFVQYLLLLSFYSAHHNPWQALNHPRLYAYNATSTTLIKSLQCCRASHHPIVIVVEIKCSAYLHARLPRMRRMRSGVYPVNKSYHNRVSVFHSSKGIHKYFFEQSAAAIRFFYTNRSILVCILCT